MRRLLSIAAVVLAVHLACGDVASAAPPIVNPKLSKTQEALAKDMSDDSLNLEHAAVVSAELLKADPGNALNHYAAARLAAWQEKWDDVLAEIEAGNKSPYAIHYQRVDGPEPRYPLNPTLRQLARAIAEAAPKIGAEKAAPVVKSFRTLTRKEAWSEPRSFINVLLGATMRNMVNRPMPGLYPAGSMEAVEAQKLVDGDVAFTKRMKPDSDRYFGEGRDPYYQGKAAKHKVTFEQVQSYQDGAKTAPAVKVRMLAMKADIESEQRPVIARWLKQLPE